MAKLPVSRQNGVKFRSPTNSEKYNDFQERAFYDIMELFNMANELQETLEATDYGLSVNGHFQQQSIVRLRQQVLVAEKELAFQKEGQGELVAFAFPENVQVDGSMDPTERAYIDRQHHLVHLPIAGRLVSKTYLYDQVTGDVVTPESLRAKAVPEEPKVQGTSIVDNDFKNAFTGETSKYWHRKMIFPLEYEPEEQVRTEFIVTLPDTVISSRNVNMITLSPYPLNSLRINKIEYRTSENSGNWALIPGWPRHNETNEALPYDFAGQLKFAFPNASMKEVKVTMTQFNWVAEEHQKVYHFGIQELGVFEANYQAEIGRFNIPFRLADQEETFTIDECIPKFQNDSALTDKTKNRARLFTYGIYTINEDGKEEYVKDTFPVTVTTRQLLLKASIHMDPHTLTTPTLESVELTYKKV